MLVKVYGCAVFGINATIVTAEVNVENGAFFQLVGLWLAPMPLMWRLWPVGWMPTLRDFVVR